MKNLLPILFLLFISCKSSFMVSQHISEKASNCPENGECTVELIPNKSLEFNVDNIGITYPVTSEGEKTLFKFTYNKVTDSSLQDSNYTEIIYAELDKTITEIDLQDEELQSIKLHFGRLCYCKGETGYFPIKNGNFKLQKTSKDSIQISIDFKISEVPQVVSSINETISIKSSKTN